MASTLCPSLARATPTRADNTKSAAARREVAAVQNPGLQDIILGLQEFWAEYGCVIVQPYNSEVGAGTFNPATFLRCLGPEPWKAAYVEPSRRPKDGRYGENPIRVQQFLQYQVLLKPAPADVLDVYYSSLEAIGIDPAAIRYRGLHMSFNPGYDPSHMLPMIELLDWARPDWEEELSRHVGDVAAHQLGNLVRGGLAWMQQAADTLTRDAGEYLKEESRDLPTRYEVDRFLDDVDRLAADLGRAEARVARGAGEPRTAGYWALWNTCAPDNRAGVAAAEEQPHQTAPAHHRETPPERRAAKRHHQATRHNRRRQRADVRRPVLRYRARWRRRDRARIARCRDP